MPSDAGPDAASDLIPAAVARPVIGNRLLTVEHRAWSVLGTALGPVRSTTLRITVTLGVDCVVERVDGQPLGDLAVRCRDQIEAARLDLEQRLRRGITTTQRRPQPTSEAQPTAAPAAPAAPVAPPASTLAAGDQRTTSSVFRCERQVITDRITRLRQEAPVAAAKADEAAERLAEQQRARERLAEIRAQYWAAQQRQEPADELLPSPAPPDAGATAAPRQHTSSVFRVDRDGITDRIDRLRRKPNPASDAAAGGPLADPGILDSGEHRV